MIKRPHLNSRHLIPLDKTVASAKYGCNSRVYFSDCHPDQSNWLKQLFLVSGVVRQAVFDTEKQEVVYELYLPANFRKIFIYESELMDKCNESASSCPWGTIESAMQDGLMVKVAEELEPEMLLDDVIKVLELDAASYMRQKRKIHILLKTAKSVVRVSYDNQPEYRIFAKRASYSEAAKALLI